MYIYIGTGTHKTEKTIIVDHGIHCYNIYKHTLMNMPSKSMIVEQVCILRTAMAMAVFKRVILSLNDWFFG
jgi:hypothetical protein